MTVRGLFGLAMVGVIGAGAFWVWQRFEGQPPQIEAPQSILLGAEPQTIKIRIADEDSGLRLASVRLLDQTGSKTLLENTYPGSLSQGGAPGTRVQSLDWVLDAEQLGVPDGQATLVIDTRDWSWRDGFSGNRTERSIPVTVDTQPPSVRVVSGLTYVYRGGSGAAVYEVDPQSQRDGVQVGEAFFPGYPHPAGATNRRIALFSIPVDAQPKVPVQVVAADAARNQKSVRFPARVLERVFRKSELPLSDAFIDQVAVPLAEGADLSASDPAETFQAVNETLRARNEATIQERLEGGSEQPLWTGAFQQWPGSQVMSRFAEHRTYVYRGEPISEARHYGFDLAATAHAPVTAAGAGRVILAEDLGLYGNCVIIDHGLGLASLYGHLSALDVAVGDDVVQGQPIGNSGDTGLAAGDHLHFAFIVGERYVDPLEWWDPKWVRSHIGVRLER